MNRSIMLGLIVLAVGDAKAESDCAMVSTVFDGPVTKQIYPARIRNIDGSNVLLEKRDHKLAPGRHELLVFETDKNQLQHARSGNRHSAKVLVLDVEAGKTYRIGAQLNSEKRLDREEYWQPVVWQVVDKPCN